MRVDDRRRGASPSPKIPAESRPTDAAGLARELFRRGKLTKFQAQALYQGKRRGLTVGNYVVLDKLGKGGMGQVYKAKHRRMDRVVALKVVSSGSGASQGALRRFQREVKAAAQLSHPNIVTAHDADEAKGIHFLVMEFVDGKDLAALVKEDGPLPVAKALDFILQAAKGLQYAHEQGVIHRDIKPANLLVDGKGTVKILDMGLARMAKSGVTADTMMEENLTYTGEVMGTLAYMAPEQALNAKGVDRRADIYSLGCTLHYLLTGRTVYAGESVAQKFARQPGQPVPSLRDHCPDVPAPLDAVFQKMIATNPDHRQQSIAEVIADLELCCDRSAKRAGSAASRSPTAASSAVTPTAHQQAAETTVPVRPLPSLLDELLLEQPVAVVDRPSQSLSRRPWSKARLRRIAVRAAVVGGVLLAIVLAILLFRGFTKPAAPPVQHTNTIRT